MVNVNDVWLRLFGLDCLESILVSSIRTTSYVEGVKA